MRTLEAIAICLESRMAHPEKMLRVLVLQAAYASVAN